MRVLELICVAIVALLAMTIITPFVLLGALLYIVAGSLSVGKDLGGELLMWLEEKLSGDADASR